MSALQAKKRKEAEENMKQADKYLAKTMFRWQPDYLGAAPYLEKAAEAYRAAGDLDLAKKVFTQASAVQHKNKSSFRAAQNQENVAKVVVMQIREQRPGVNDKMKLLLEVKKAYEAASGYYGDMGELGKAAEALVKGASTCEENGIDDVKDMYLRACGLLETQEKPHFAIDTFRKTLSYLVKKQLYVEALALQERLVALFKQIDQVANVHKCYLSEAVLRLTIGDIPAADNAYTKHLQEDSYLTSDECALEEDLVRAFKMGNEELLQETIRKQGFSFLDNQIARLVRKLSMYGGKEGVTAAPAPPRRAPIAPSAPSARLQPSSTNPFAPPAPQPVRTAPEVNNYEYVPSAPAAAAAAVSAENEYDASSSMANMTIASEDDRRTSEFNFDALEFADSAPVPALEKTVPSSSSNSEPQRPAPTAAPPVMDDEMLDLT